MFTVPVPAGEVACIVVAELTVWPVAAVVPKLTVVEFITKPVPVMTTFVPPATGPAAGDKEVTVGKGEALARCGKYPIRPTVKTITAITSPRRPAGFQVTEGSSRARKLDEDRRTGPALMRSTERFGPVHPDPESRNRLGPVCAASSLLDSTGNLTTSSSGINTTRGVSTRGSWSAAEERRNRNYRPPPALLNVLHVRPPAYAGRARD